MPLDVLAALRGGPRSRAALLADLDAEDRQSAEEALRASIASGDVVVHHLQTMPARTLYGLSSRAEEHFPGATAAASDLDAPSPAATHPEPSHRDPSTPDTRRGPANRHT